MEARVLDKDNQIVEAGKQGKLAVKSPSVIPYYWRDPEKTKQYLTEDGWLYTDDIVYQDDEGFFYYVGRSDDVIKSSGWTISPVEIENVLSLHPAVSEAGVFDISDPEKGKIPVAAVVLKKGIEGSVDLTLELQGFVKTRLAPFKYPREIYYMASLPRTVTGKLLRYQLREKFSQYANLSAGKDLLPVE
jgi:benzoate-CoA ligase